MSRKTNNGENDKKPDFKPNFVPRKLFFLSFTSTSSYKLFQAIILGNLKEN